MHVHVLGPEVAKRDYSEPGMLKQAGCSGMSLSGSVPGIQGMITSELQTNMYNSPCANGSLVLPYWEFAIFSGFSTV
jgi:hypothetical protein